MNWILLMWVAFGQPTVEQTMTLEECKARAEAHVRSQHIAPRALCVKRDGKAVVAIDPK